MTAEGKTRLSLRRQALGLAVLIVLCLSVAALGGLATSSRDLDWYAQLAKPAWGPPDWVFGPVWTVLYVSMAVAAWLVWRQDGISAAKIPLALFAVQLALNGLWSFVFFAFQQPGAAAIEIVLLLGAVLATAVAFWRRSRCAGLMLVPYLAWVAFAAVLNCAIWQMNV